MVSHVFIGTEVGLLKGADVEKGTFQNFNTITNLSKDDEITAMCWESESEKKIYTGHRDQAVRVFNCENQSYQNVQALQVGKGPVKGLHHWNGHLITAVESGIVKLWNEDNEKKIEIDTGGNLNRMIASTWERSQIATGGEENDLKIYDLEKPEIVLFKAKNVKNDFLDLRVPVWITDMKFQSSRQIITCTRHHQIRLYDIRVQRRPVIDMEFEKHPLMSLSLAQSENQVVVGSSRGRMALVDLRRKLLVHVFKGFAGSIRHVQCHPTRPVVASCGLDRFLRIHDLNSKKLLKKIYLKTRLNCLLLQSTLPETLKDQKPSEIKNSKQTPIDEESEKIWTMMDTVEEGKKKRKILDKTNVGKVKKKK